MSDVWWSQKTDIRLETIELTVCYMQYDAYSTKSAIEDMLAGLIIVNGIERIATE